ncbi:MAG: alpha-amylase family glycosyl hydrolase [Shimia sp.]
MSEWWRGAIVYQIYPRSFQDSTGDGIGDLPGITRRLEHVASLGVDAIWLSPIFRSPMKDMGYDVSDYVDIDPLFGTLADFDAMLARAHELGLKVIIDQVISHSSDKHAWFEESRASRDNPKADWYVWADPNPDGTPPNNWPSVFGGPAWEWEPRRRQYYLHNFLASQPDLNLHNPDVQDALLGTVRFWLERGVDGFRLDTVNYYFHDQELRDNPPNPDRSVEMSVDTYGMQSHVYSKNRPENIDFLKRMRALTDEFDARMMVGEVGDQGQTAIDIMADYTRGTDRLHMCYSFEMLGPKFSAEHFRRTIDGFQKGAPDGWPSWSFSNHDVPRHVTRWAQHGKWDAVAKQAISMLLAFEGSIGIYQGEELGLPQTEMEYHELTDPPAIRFWPEEKGRDGCRTPLVWESEVEHGGFTDGTPWLPVKAPQLERSVDRQEAENDGVLAHYRGAIAYRQASRTLKHGKTRFIALPEPLLAFHRGEGADQLTCVFNLSPGAVEVGVEGDVALDGPSAAQLTEGRLHLPPNGFAYLTGADVVLRAV